MTWYLLKDAAELLRISERSVWRKIRTKELHASKNDDGKVIVNIDDSHIEAQPTLDTSGQLPIVARPIPTRITLPELPQSKITPDTVAKIDIMMASIRTTEGITELESQIEIEHGIPRGTLARWKSQLRKLYELPSRSPLHHLSAHPQIRQALAFILTRKQNSNTGSMNSAKGLCVVKGTGEHVNIDNYLKQLYAFPDQNATSVYRALVNEFRSGRIVREHGDSLEVVNDGGMLPSESTVSRFLRKQLKQDVALRRSRMTRAARTQDRIYVSRPDDEYRPGGLLEGDHTEDNIVVYRNDGSVGPLWCTLLVDFRTGLIKGYELAYRPNSNTIALAFKRACLGTQLFARTSDGYVAANLVDAPDKLRYDNGKDYKSAYTGQTVGRIDFSDEARSAARLVCELEHTGRRHPQAKGTVEGTFKIIQQSILKYLPGYKGSNYGKKPDEFPTQVKAGVLLTEEEYRKLFQNAVNTINNRPRKDLGGISPLQFYLANQSQMKFVDERSLNFLQMKWNGGRGEGVRIRRGFVRMLGCEYFSMDLDSYNGQSAQLYYDPANIGRVAVYVKGEFVTFAVDKELLGVSERDWLVIVKERARRNREIAEEIRSIRKGMTFEEAKAILFNAEINNVSEVDPAVLQRRTPVVVHLTGIESKAKEFHEKLDEQIKREENEEKRKKKSTPLSLINVNNIR